MSAALDPRHVTLIGSNLLFAAVSALLIFYRGWSPLFYPLYGSIFLWSDARRESETQVIFVFLASAAALLLAAVSPGAQRLPILGEMGGLWLLAWALDMHRGRAEQDRRALDAEQGRLEADSRDAEREIQYYRDAEESVAGQIRLRRDLLESARSLGSTLDAREVHVRLIHILSSRYPRARVEVAAGSGGDALLELAARLKSPVMVKDARDDPRFKAARLPCRSALAVPLRVMRQAAGFVRLDSSEPGAFGPEDVRAVDLFATMAALSLENIQFYESVQQQAVHDPLTQLYSHRAFQQRLQEELLRAGRSQTPLSLLMCDVDHFKSYNDRYGHQAGDQLLRTVSQILISFARPVDLPARYGGEEFALILPSFVRSEAVELAQRLRQRVEAEPFVFQGQRTRATFSIGVASFPQDATTPSQMIRVADERLYRAKEGGRNQVVG